MALRAGRDVLEQREVSCRSLVTVPTEPPDAVSCGTKLILPLLAYNKSFQTGSWPHPAPVQMVPDSFPRVRWPGRNLATYLRLLLRFRMTGAYLCSPYIPSWRGHVVQFRYDLRATYCRQRSADVGLSFTDCCCSCQMLVQYIVQSRIGCLYFVTLACLCSDFCVNIL